MALQLRRGTNAERLSMTPLIGELIFVTDYDLATLSVTAINATTDTLTSVAHGLAVNQQIKFQDANLNGLVLNQVYFVKTVPSSDTFTLSLTLAGAVVDITGTFSIPLIFATSPTDAAGAPLGTNSTPLWVGDGVTVGGIVAASLSLDDLLDVDLTSLAEGNTFYYDATTGFWRNTNIINVNDVTNNVTLLGDLAVNGGDITTNVGAGGIANLYNSSAIGTINIGNSVVTEVNIGNTGSGRVFAKTPSFETQSNAIIGGDLTVTGADIGTGADNVRLQVNRTVASGDPQNVFKRSLLIRAVSAGTPAIGYGPALGFVGQTTATSSGNFEEAGAIAVTATDLTATAEAFKMTFNLMHAGAQDQTVMELDSTGNLQIDGDLAVNGGDITTTQTTGNLFNATATTVNIGNGATTEVNLGATASGQVQIKSPTIVGANTTQAVFNTVATTVNAFGAATAALSIGPIASGTATIGYDATIRNNLTVTGGNIDRATAGQANIFNVNANEINIGNSSLTTRIGAGGVLNTNTVLIKPGILLGETTTQAVFNTVATTVNAFGAATATAIGAATGTTTIGNNLTVTNDLAVNGGDITTTQTTGNLFNATATTVNVGFGATSEVNLGASGSGRVQIKSPTIVGEATTQAVFNTVATTVNAFGASTATNIGANSGTMTIGNPTVVGTQTTQNLYNTVATTLNIGGASQGTNIGSTAGGTTTIGRDLSVLNDLFVADSITVDNQAQIQSSTLTTTSTATVALNTTTRNAMTGLINIIQGSDVHCVNFTAVKTGASTAMLTTYAEMYDNISLASFTADVSGSFLRLLVTPSSATSTVFSVVRTSLT